MAKTLTENQRAFLDVLWDSECNGDYKKAMIKAGYSEKTNPIAVIKGLREEIIEATELYIAMNAPKAAIKISDVVDNPGIGSRDALAAAKELLDRAGIVKTEKIDANVRGGGVVILPAKKEVEEED